MPEPPPLSSPEQWSISTTRGKYGGGRQMVIEADEVIGKIFEEVAPRA